MSDKERTLKLQKEWRENNSDHVKKVIKKWKENNPDRVKVLAKKWRENNPDRVKKVAKEWKENNPDRVKKVAKEWKENNPDRVKVLAKEWRENNPDRVKVLAKKWRENNPDRVKVLAKEWRENNKDYIKEVKKKWRENNKDYIKEKNKEWRENNKDYIKEKNKKYYEKEKQNNIIKELLLQYYISCIHNYQYRMQVFKKLLDYKMSSIKRVGVKFKELIDSIPVLYVEHVVFFYCDYFYRHYKTEDSQKIHLEEMIHLAKKQNILFPEELSYKTYEEQQRVIFYILFQMSEHDSCEKDDDYMITLEKAGFKTEFILDPLPFEGNK